MNIKPGQYQTISGDIARVTGKREQPLLVWIGRIQQRPGEYSWYLDGREVSGYQGYNLIKRVGEDAIIEGD